MHAELTERFLIYGILVILVSILLIRRWLRYRRLKPVDALEVSPAQGINQQGIDSAVRVMPKGYLSKSPHFGYVASIALLLVLIPMWYLTSRRIIPKGIYVYTSDKSIHSAVLLPGLNRTILRIDANNQWFLNEMPVNIQDVQKALIHEISRYPNGVIYIDADANVDYENVVQVMDIIQGLNARIVLLTPGNFSQPVWLEHCGKIPFTMPGLSASLDGFRIMKGEQYQRSPLVHLVIDSSGKVSKAILLKSSGVHRLDEAVLRDARDMRFKSRPGCPAIETNMSVTIDFW